MTQSPTISVLQVLRGAGYFDHALFVAQAAGEAGWYLDILLDDCASYDAALAYLQGLTREEAGAALKKHGKVTPGQSVPSHIAWSSLTSVILA